MTRKVPIRATADANGNVRIERLEKISIPVKLRSVSFRTTVTSREREHKVSADVMGQRVLEGRVSSADSIAQSTAIRLSGQAQIILSADGFDPHEVVEAEAVLDFGVSLFG
jgi:hypothetical protein